MENTLTESLLSMAVLTAVNPCMCICAVYFLDDGKVPDEQACCRCSQP